jgi:DNA modification methylase
VPSWRQENGDKRADPRGRVPGDVFDFTRVTGNSKQRRAWHPTQLNEGLVDRCIKLTTPPGDPVLDPFAGTGTTLRVCKALGNPCTLIELDPGYCKRIAAENGLETKGGEWCSS